MNTTGIEVTPDEYQRYAHGAKIIKPLPICKVCRQEVHTYGVHSVNPNIRQRFDHPNFPPENDPYDDCPLANRQRARYIGLSSDEYSKESGDRLKTEFFEIANLRYSYSFMHKLAGKGNFPTRLFELLIRRADKRRIWDYAYMPVWCVPYILMTLGQFSSATGKTHFGFNRAAHSVNNLWEGQANCELLKYYSDSGRIVRTAFNPLVVSEASFQNIAAPKGECWVTEDFGRSLFQFKTA